MCRIFGFRSILQSGVHSSLINADNSIIHQSERHPDGWGVAYYNMGSPHLIKLDNQASECKIFERVSGVVSSQTVLAHIRKSTVGPIGPLNTHPFQYGQWVFAHNGNVKGFPGLREQFLKKVDLSLRPYVLGETDSEMLFYILLSIIKRKGYLTGSDKKLDFSEVLNELISTVQSIAGPLSESKGDYTENYLTFVLSNGQNLYAFQGGQPLFYSSHKTLCPERSTCQHFHPLCEAKANVKDKVHHLLVSSEKIDNENVWTPLNFGEFVGVNEGFLLQNGKISL